MISSWLYNHKVIFKILVWASRILVGGAFIFSGFSKADDLWGTIFKIEQYLAIWDITQPRSLVFAASIFISVVEFLLGFSLATGIYRRGAPRIVGVFLLFFIPLTAYIAIASPVDDCGCFGDAWIISNNATFLKNIFLGVLTLFLIVYNRKISGLFTEEFQWMAGAASLLYIVTIALTGYNLQPVIDFRNYPKGTALRAESSEEKDPRFIYKKGDETRIFDMDNLPSENEGWTYVDRIDDETFEAPIIIEDADGDDVTEDVIPAHGDLLILIISEPERADLAATMYINRIFKVASGKGIPMIALLGSASENDIDSWVDLSLAEYPVYSVESTTLKALARGTMAYVYVRNGKVLEKKSLSMISTDSIEQLEKGKIDIEEIVGFNGSKVFEWLTRTYCLILIVLLMLSVPHRYFRLRKFKKQQEGGKDGLQK